MSSHDNKFFERFGPWAFVSGASSGIGHAFAIELARRGFSLMLVGRSEQKLAATSERALLLGSPLTHVLPLDLATSDGLAAATTAAESRDIGLLVAAAGFGTSGYFIDGDLATEAAMLQLNCASVMTLIHNVGRSFASRGRGGIILMGSLLGFQGTPYSAHYAATKAYIQTFAEGLYRELKPLGVDVIASAPGPVDSGFAERARMRMSLTENPDIVAIETLRKLGKAGTVTPGIFSKLLTYSLLPLPRSLRSRIMEQIMDSMTKHHRTAPAERR